MKGHGWLQLESNEKGYLKRTGNGIIDQILESTRFGLLPARDNYLWTENQIPTKLVVIVAAEVSILVILNYKLQTIGIFT